MFERRNFLDIAALSIVMKQAQVKQQASLSVMKSAMNTAENNAVALLDMLNQSTGQTVSHPYLGQKVDLKA